jgi:dephospho-CoA kinase
VQAKTLINQIRPGTSVDHIGSTVVPGLIGKNVVDLQVTASPAEVPAITGALLGLGFAQQRGRDPWPPERPMLEGTFRRHNCVFALHCYVVPSTDTDVHQMIEFRELLRAHPKAREVYAADKRRITAGISDSLEYTQAKTHLIQRLLGN